MFYHASAEEAGLSGDFLSDFFNGRGKQCSSNVITAQLLLFLQSWMEQTGGQVEDTSGTLCFVREHLPDATGK